MNIKLLTAKTFIFLKELFFLLIHSLDEMYNSQKITIEFESEKKKIVD